MSRWHSSSCSDPRIVVEQQRPRCESCSNFPDIDGLVAGQVANASPIPFLPRDEPPGQMHLWWPPCVPYVTTGPDGRSPPVQPPQDDVPSLSSVDRRSSTEPCRQHIYPQRLKGGEFRVLCLYPVRDVNAPIHVTLEVYDDLRYHEYETVSYTWGGENGDSSLCQPVYIGPYWDILLQTRNCWEMLRHMRPWKGVRSIWVDAICINQTDVQERQEQVAKMGRIYEKASRVVVYLGPDLVPPTSTLSPYPRRCCLQELDTLLEEPRLPSDSLISPKKLKLSDVLGREYFRRLWIIQELIMSRNITLRIGDVEFIVDQRVSTQPVDTCNIPWFTFITRGVIDDPSGNSLRNAVELAGNSRASDPRDKIFGILGLIDSGEHHVAASYSISFRHLAIGYYAYCLLIKKDIRVIIQASRIRAPEGMPSWTPSALYDASGSGHLISGTGGLQSDWLYKSKYLLEAYSMNHSCLTNLGPGIPMIAISPAPTRHTCLKLSCEWVRVVEEVQSSFKACWHSHATIDSSTGAIQLTAMHLLCFGGSQTAEIERKGDVDIYKLRTGASTLFIYANTGVLTPADELDKLHLFVLCDNPDEPFEPRKHFRAPLDSKSRLCVLQQVNDEAKFRLLSASVIACFHVPHKFVHPFYDSEAYHHEFLDFYRFGSNIRVAHDDKLSFSLAILRTDCPAGKLVAENTAPYRFIDGQKRSLNVQNLCMPFRQHVGQLRKLWAGLDDVSGCDQYFSSVRRERHIRYPSPRWAFPGVKNGTNFLEVFQSILDAEKSDSSAGFFNVYFRTVREFSPRFMKWKNQPSNKTIDADHEQVSIIELVQLKFEPNQYHVLEGILDSIQEDFHKAAEHTFLFKPPRVDQSQGDFYPPFLRIGWRDLALNQQSEALGSCGLTTEDVHGFDGLDAMSEWIEKYGRTRGMSEPVCDDSIIREHRDQTIWVAFDLLSLMLWAQTHPCMVELRRLSRFCKDGENEMTRMLRPSTEEEKRWTYTDTYTDWPSNIIKDFKIDGEFRSIAIV